MMSVYTTKSWESLIRKREDVPSAFLASYVDAFGDKEDSFMNAIYLPEDWALMKRPAMVLALKENSLVLFQEVDGKIDRMTIPIAGIEAVVVSDVLLDSSFTFHFHANGRLEEERIPFHAVSRRYFMVILEELRKGFQKAALRQHEEDTLEELEEKSYKLYNFTTEYLRPEDRILESIYEPRQLDRNPRARSHASSAPVERNIVVTERETVVVEGTVSPTRSRAEYGVRITIMPNDKVEDADLLQRDERSRTLCLRTRNGFRKGIIVGRGNGEKIAQLMKSIKNR